MLIPMNCEEFLNRFPAANQLNTGFGRWADESDRVHTYYTNAAGEVAEAIYEPRTTRHTYNRVCGEPADTLKRMYGK